jgi:L-lactate utilization protein LutB
MDYTKLASSNEIENTMAALNKRGHLPQLAATRAEALAIIKNLIPQGASVMNGSSRTLEEIGFVDYLKTGSHGWRNLHEAILAEKDPTKQAILRKQSVLSDYYIGSAHAVAATGEILVASNSGSQLPHLAFTSPNLILVIGAQKIVPNLQAAFERLEKHVLPLENERMQKAIGTGTYLSKILIINKE